MLKAVQTVGLRWIKAAAAGALCAGLLTGCMSSSDETVSGGGSAGGSGSSSSGTGGVFGSILTSGKGPREVNPDAFASEIYCPPIKPRLNTYLIMKYERGHEDEPKHLLYQATLQEWARECSREGTDQTRIKLGLSGNVTPGPAWKGGEIVLPIRVAVMPSGDSEKPLMSDLVSVPVTVGQGAPAEGWTMVENKYVVQRNTEVMVVFGFDEGPQKKRR
ncbi:hypothetical protein SAMN05444272_0651 [Roseibium suaedae]|uniref:Lipoprotein n=2 Tax=Roseibium suaedae TaxID=735517 RepID=A0A1M7AV27_9HYPH|nr:hypothetical protein SAMN05444272_0651 [Roseibium suaedae]